MLFVFVLATSFLGSLFNISEHTSVQGDTQIIGRAKTAAYYIKAQKEVNLPRIAHKYG